MDAEKAKHFAKDWIQAWNAHDLNAVFLTMMRV
jgi:hypothetical protein